MKILLIFIPILQGCYSNKNLTSFKPCENIELPCLATKKIILMHTSRGIMKLEIDGTAAPLTAGNFLDLVNRGVYDFTEFHRVIREPSPFVIQGGDPLTSIKGVPKTSYGTGNYIDQATGKTRYIPLEIKISKEDIPLYDYIVSDPIELSQIQLKHQKGSLAMARSQSLGSASAQFYIGLRSLPELDGRYAVFGKVIDGMDVLDQIELGDKIIRMSVFK